MRFEVKGVQKQTGKRVKASIEARNLDEAIQLASRNGILVDQSPVNPTPDNGQPANPAIPPELRFRSRRSKAAFWIAGIASVIFVSLLACAGLMFSLLKNNLGGAGGKSTNQTSWNLTNSSLLTGSAEALTAVATKDAWTTIYQTDTRARGQWTSGDLEGALESIVSGYRLNSQNVDPELVTFADRHISAAGNLAEVKRGWNSALRAVDHNAEVVLQKAIDTFLRPLSRVATDPEKTLQDLITVARLKMQFDIKDAREKVDARFKSRFDAAFTEFKNSTREKSRIAETLAARHKKEFPVGLVFNE